MSITSKRILSKGIKAAKLSSASLGGEVPSSTVVMNYALTDTLLDLVTGASLEADVLPTPTSDGVSLDASSGASLPISDLPVNNFEITFDAIFQSNPATGVIFDNRFLSTLDRFGVVRQSGAFTFAKSKLGDGSVSVSTGATAAIADITIESGYSFTVVQSSTDGISLRVRSFDGSYDSTATNTFASAKADMNPWQAYFNLAERDGGTFVTDITIKNIKIRKLFV
jgi:hypothetical protein